MRLITSLLCLLALQAQAEGIFEVGPSQIGDNFTTGWIVTYTERVKDRYDFTAGYITPQEYDACDHPSCQWYIKEQIFFGAEVVFKYPNSDNLRLGFGPYIFQNPDRVAPTRLRVGVHLEYRFNKHFGISARHWSTAGSSPRTTICRDEARFDSDPGFILEPGHPRYAGLNCKTNDWNTGQDSWLRLAWYF